jgi:hypothetical protein
MMKKQKPKRRHRPQKDKRERSGGFRLRPLPLNGMDPELVKTALLAAAGQVLPSPVFSAQRLIELLLDLLDGNKRQYLGNFTRYGTRHLKTHTAILEIFIVFFRI